METKTKLEETKRAQKSGRIVRSVSFDAVALWQQAGRSWHWSVDRRSVLRYKSSGVIPLATAEALADWNGLHPAEIWGSGYADQ
jgi:hypothetical protein